MQKINEYFSVLDSYIGGSQWFIFILLGTGLFFTIYLGFPQIRYFTHALKIVRGKYDADHHEGDISHFQSLSTALSGTVGTGNIAGVAFAIHLGGPGALFWMLITAVLGMTTKMVEVTLSHKYREKSEDGFISGGPMYYMKNGLKMKWMAVLFAICTIFSSFGTGNFSQINNVANAMHSSFGIQHHMTGAVLAILLGLIILGGIKRIASVTTKLVPFMGIVYILGALSIIVYNYDNLWSSFSSIFVDVFSGTAATGGFLGAGFVWAFNRGVNRGLFSNEAGQGSAPIAHATAKTDEPVSEGMVALLEPFVDTIIICFLTGMVILSSGVWTQKYDNTFQSADIVVLNGIYSEQNETHKQQVANHVHGTKSLPLYNGELPVKDGKITGKATFLHSRSFAENVQITKDGKPFTGAIHIKEGIVHLSQNANNLAITGKSLIHSAPLSTEAFKKGIFGRWGEFVIPISLLLFAFSSSIAWAYYGSRAVTFLWGVKYVKPFFIIYIIGYFIAAFVDTTLVWTITGITVALMTIPNLIGIFLLRKDMKESLQQYVQKIK